MSARRGFAMIRIVPIMALLALASVIAADAQQRRGGRGADRCVSPEECPRTPYDGRFTFVRVYFPAGGGAGLAGFGGFGGEPPWHHDRPDAERNLSSIIREITFLRTFDGWHGGNVFALDDPEIFRYPLLWLAEPGYWQPTTSEAEALRTYLLKGGFIIFDDFRGPHWHNFEAQMRRVLPELTPIRLMGDEPIFRSFFEIDMHALRVAAYSDTPEYWGFFEDNDPTKRQLAVVNYNNDIGEFMEYSDTGFAPVDIANEAYKLGVNYVVYAHTH
ncbi:hypothetical protein BH23ACI1_BH23ACI1_09140 [soil metagenome]